MYRAFLKRIIDIALSGTALIILSPLLLLLTGLLAASNSGKPFFIQARPGLRERVFRIVKFRTMNDKRDAAGRLLPDADRLTGVGRLVRRTSLDELPQLVNVLVGDMSLIGPRPLLVEYLPLYDATQRRRHDVRPGITGWAQVNGRNAISWQEKFAYDVWYVDHLSFALDMKILYRTFVKVFRSEGISSATAATMEKFKGNA